MMTELNASHGTVEGKRDILVKDLKGVIGDADDLLQAVAGSTADGFAVARTKVEDRLGEVKSRLVDARLAVTERARGAADASNEYLKDNTWKALGVAVAAGFLIGFLLKRR
jgi:ElaB/YqjD/DUF883 family membrane-anchored ribosome-binding protein